MSDVDERPLIRGGPLEEPLQPPAARTASGPIVIITSIGLILGAFGAWWWTRDAAAPPRNAPPATTATDATIPSSEGLARALPPLDQMDTFLRALLGTLSSHPELARWLATDDLIRQLANGIDRVSRGGSPARDLAVLKPKRPFTVPTRARETTIDPETYRRFDALAGLVESLDARAVADVYRTIRPRLDEAYRGLGRTEGSVDAAVSAALQVLLDTPAPTGPVRVVPGPGVTYVFADPTLEGLQPAQKQLLRMGPDNLARVQTRLREIKSAIEAAPPPDRRGAR
jgi:hypothetical protein